MLLLKYDSSGNLISQKLWGGSNINIGYSVTVTDWGKVFVFASTADTTGSFSDASGSTGTPSGSIKSPSSSLSDITSSITSASLSGSLTDAPDSSTGGNDFALIEF